MLAKHSKHFDLIHPLSVDLDWFQRSWHPLRERVDFMRNKALPIRTARAE